MASTATSPSKAGVDLINLQKIVIISSGSNLDEPPAAIAFLKGNLCDMVGPDNLVTLNDIYETFEGQSESTLSIYLEVLDLDVKERTEIDMYGASEIQKFIMDALTDLIPKVDDWAANRSTVVDEYGVRREEIEDQIDYLIEENDISEEGSKLFDI